MNVGAAPRQSSGAVDNKACSVEHHAHELVLRGDRFTPGASAHCRQDDTSESQLIAFCRRRARSPMSMPVVVAIDSIGVLMRSSGE